jgi:hypothetical protein
VYNKEKQKMKKIYDKREFLGEAEEELNSSINSDDNGSEGDLAKEKNGFSTPDMTPKKLEKSKTTVSDFNLQGSPTPVNDVFSPFNKSSNNFFNSLQQNNESGVRKFNSYDSLNAEWSENEPSSSLVDNNFSPLPKNIEVMDCDPDQSFLNDSEEREEKGDKADNLLLSVILCALIAVLSFVVYLIFFGSSDKKEEENL